MSEKQQSKKSADPGDNSGSRRSDYQDHRCGIQSSAGWYSW